MACVLAGRQVIQTIPRLCRDLGQVTLIMVAIYERNLGTSISGAGMLLLSRLPGAQEKGLYESHRGEVEDR